MTERPRIEPATADDVDHIVDVVQSAYRGDRSRAGWTTEADLIEGQRADATMVRHALDAPDTTVLLAFDGADPAHLLGCCEVRVHAGEDGAAHFGMFAVSPARQAGGLGSALLDAAERHAGSAGATALEMWVIEQRHELIAWYRRRGYEPTGEHHPFPYGDERFGLPRRDDLRFVVLSKPLPPGAGRS
ncbi:MAG: GNAT family N-acetyltransferase [Microthrixaceae bacterium]